VDPFHVVMLATEALDDVRREVWNEARRQGNLELARELKGARFAVSKNRRTSPIARPSSSPRSSRRTLACTAPTCSRSSCARSTVSPRRPPSDCWTGGWRGRVAADCRRS
jgi:transposase